MLIIDVAGGRYRLEFGGFEQALLLALLTILLFLDLICRMLSPASRRRRDVSCNIRIDNLFVAILIRPKGEAG